VRIVLADDAALFREGVANLLREAGFDVVGQAENADDLLALVGEHQPDVVIVDIRMPPSHTLEGLEAAKIIRARYPAVGVLVLSQFVEPYYALQLIDNAEKGAGYLLKDRVGNIEELADAVRQIATGRLIIDPAVVSQLLNRSRRRDPLDALTDREKAVLALMAQGRSNHAIANGLFVTEKILRDSKESPSRS
jgi:DNA-binding NarL/FixJ family response regulator